MSPYQTRIELLEERLSVLTLRVNHLARDAEQLVVHVDKLFNSDGIKPGLFGRIIAIEKFIEQLRWAVGALYGTAIGIFLKLVLEK